MVRTICHVEGSDDLFTLWDVPDPERLTVPPTRPDPITPGNGDDRPNYYPRPAHDYVSVSSARCPLNSPTGVSTQVSPLVLGTGVSRESEPGLLDLLLLYRGVGERIVGQGYPTLFRTLLCVRSLVLDPFNWFFSTRTPVFTVRTLKESTNSVTLSEGPGVGPS